MSTPLTSGVPMAQQQLCAAVQGPSCPLTAGPLWRCQHPAQQQHQVRGGALGVVLPTAVVLTVPPAAPVVAAIVPTVLLFTAHTQGYRRGPAHCSACCKTGSYISRAQPERTAGGIQLTIRVGVAISSKEAEASS